MLFPKLDTKWEKLIEVNIQLYCKLHIHSYEKFEGVIRNHSWRSTENTVVKVKRTKRENKTKQTKDW